MNKKPTLLYFYNKEKFEERKRERESLKEKVPVDLIQFLEGKPYHFTVYSQRKNK